MGFVKCAVERNNLKIINASAEVYFQIRLHKRRLPGRTLEITERPVLLTQVLLIQGSLPHYRFRTSKLKSILLNVRKPGLAFTSESSNWLKTFTETHTFFRFTERVFGDFPIIKQESAARFITIRHRHGRRWQLAACSCSIQNVNLATHRYCLGEGQRQQLVFRSTRLGIKNLDGRASS
jgi:hypothetical protein